MNVDHFFTIGAQHVRGGSPCEDYALSELSAADGSAYAAIADGCGGAFANTDIGARAICFAFEEAIRKQLGQPLDWFSGAFLDDLKSAFSARFNMSGRPMDYLATLGAVVANPERASVFLFGDGAYLVRYADGRHRLTWLEWSGNAPFYLRYLQDANELARWARGFAEEGETEAPASALECWTDFRVGPNGETEVLEEASRPLALDTLMGGYLRTFEPAAQGIEAIAIFSDGILRVNDVPEHEAAREFTSFKNFRGGFVKRRMTRALEDYAKKNSKPQDDLAVACVWFGE
jgi:hypothetical protein